MNDIVLWQVFKLALAVVAAIVLVAAVLLLAIVLIKDALVIHVVMTGGR